MGRRLDFTVYFLLLALALGFTLNGLTKVSKSTKLKYDNYVSQAKLDIEAREDMDSSELEAMVISEYKDVSDYDFRNSVVAKYLIAKDNYSNLDEYLKAEYDAHLNANRSNNIFIPLFFRIGR